MAGTALTKDANASMDASTGMMAPQITGLLAGEDLDAVAPCYIDGSTGKVKMSVASTLGAADAAVSGFTPRATAEGQPCTLFGVGARFRYGTGLTPGALLYLFTTKGTIGTTAQTAHPLAVAQVIDTTDIRIIAAI